MAHPQGWEVGMTVCVVHFSGHKKFVREDTITKIGRRWITLSGNKPDRFDGETMHLDGAGYGSPGRVYPSRAEYETSTEAEIAWRDLRQRLPYHPPKGMTPERIRELAKELTQ